MPVKVRCSGCNKVLNAPDRARGKAIRCPSCETRVRVPAKSGGSKKAARSKAAAGGRGTSGGRRRKPARRSSGEEDFLAGLDVRELEDRSAPVCPKCGADLAPEDELCPDCGIDLATGKVPEKRKGPDPAKFYGEAWSDSWAFMTNNVNLALKTGAYWTLFLVLYICSLWMIIWCEKVPPMIFWGAIAFLFLVGPLGWWWYLTMEVIKTTLDKKKRRVKRAGFDFFLCISLGLKALIWPYFILLPVLVAALPVMFLAGIGAAVTGRGVTMMSLMAIGVYFTPMFVFPVAMVHMTMPYTYKAWLPWDMLKISVMNIGPVLYWLLVSVVVTLPIFLIATVITAYLGGEVWEAFVKAVLWITVETLELFGFSPAENPSEFGFVAKTTSAVLGVIALTLVIAPFAFSMAFPALFIMRAIGLLAYYNRRTLELVYTRPANVPCGFWVRYLATLVDILILGVIGGILFKFSWTISSIMADFGIAWLVLFFFFAPMAIMPIITMIYYIRSEAGFSQGTLGKRSLGIIVTDLNGEPISMGQSVGRYFARSISGGPLGLGLLMAAFTEQKQTLHDMLTHTRVVWRGDDELSE